MYTLEMAIPNIRHKSWWWNGKTIYKFNDIDELVSFMTAHIPMSDKDIDFIYDNDERKKNGRLDCTSWYTVEKGEHQMTDYTSF